MLEIQPLSTANLQDVNQCDGAFLVQAHLELNLHNGKLTYTAVPVAPYQKAYPLADEEMNIESFMDNSAKIIFLAYWNGKLAGQIDVIKWWNGFAYINDLVVQAEFRKQGVGRALLARALAWAQTQGFPGVMLETQNNNVPACNLYKKIGFELGGFDQYLYRGLDQNAQEIALFWYLVFEGR